MKLGLSRDGIKRPFSTVHVQERVRHLEELVLTLMKSSVNGLVKSAPVRECPDIDDATSSTQEVVFAPESNTSPNRETSKETIATTVGRLIRDSKGESYVGDANWEAVLEDIADLKDHFDNDLTEDQTPETDGDKYEPHILFGFNNHASRFDIMSSIPTRPICDRLLSRYFNSIDMGQSIPAWCLPMIENNFLTFLPVAIHSPTFLKEVSGFWCSGD
jgi:hypothetical protein